jgi:eukaryotic-like serine/threonine-protein kinase
MLTPGTRIGGTLEVLGPLGAGGMGEVYRARDTKLGREVAVKVLPPELASDPDRMSRFEHEARSASALNHPNIITLHDIGRDGGTSYQVLELVQGKTLRDLLAKGPMTLRVVLQIAEQIASGLAAAHAASIVHRDLKPENIMVRDDGVVKILDFGLAKMRVGDARGDSHLLTATAVTSPGAILGTVGYMSPEQARGEAVDYRSDHFALGAVMYEMLSGARPFSGDSTAQTLVAIIEKEPEPLSRARADVPRPVMWILDRCLAKSPRERYASTLDLARDLRNVREHLSEMSQASGVAEAVRRPRRIRAAAPLLWVALGVLGGVLLALQFAGGRSGPPVVPPKMSTITFSGQDYLPAASADGRMLAFVSMRDGMPRIWLKSLVDGTEVPLTSGPDYRPRVSPDGSMVLFARNEGTSSSLYRVATLGGEPRKLVQDAIEGDWSPGGDRLAFLRLRSVEGGTATDIVLTRADGGGEQVVGTVNNGSTGGCRWSPDGRWIAVSVTQYGGSESAAKYVQLVKTDGSDKRQLRPPVDGGDITGIAWVGDGDEILYSQGESISTVSLGGAVVNAGASRIFRQNIDSGQSDVILWTPTLATVIEIVGPGHIVLDAVTARQNLQEFDLSRGPDAVGGHFLSRGASLDRQPVYSPDGEWVAFSSNQSGNLDIWARSTRTRELRRLTDDPADDWDPAFTHDGKHLIWTSRRGGNFEIWMANADGSGARQLTHDGVDAENATATPDAAWIVYNSGNPDKTGIWKVRSDGSDATRLVDGVCAWPEVSPDGHYASFAVPTGSGATTIRVVRIDDGTLVPFTIELGGSEVPNGRTRWMPDGHTLAFTWNSVGRIGVYAQEFRPEGQTETSRRPLIQLDPAGIAETFGIAPDGSRLTLAATYRAFSLLSIENVAGVEPQRRHPR